MLAADGDIDGLTDSADVHICVCDKLTDGLELPDRAMLPDATRVTVSDGDKVMDSDCVRDESGLAGREADMLRDVLTDGVTPPARRDALTDGDTAPPIALAERERDGERERDVDGLADALTSSHCT